MCSPVCMCVCVCLSECGCDSDGVCACCMIQGNTTILISAAYNGQDGCVRLLLDRGAAIEAKDDEVSVSRVSCGSCARVVVSVSCVAMQCAGCVRRMLWVCVTVCLSVCYVSFFLSLSLSQSLSPYVSLSLSLSLFQRRMVRPYTEVIPYSYMYTRI